MIFAIAASSFTPISANTVVNDGNTNTTLAEIYEIYGASELCRRVHLLTGLTVDDYATVIPSTAQQLAELVGGIEYARVSTAVADGEVSVPSGQGTVSGKQVRTLLLCDYSGSSITRERVASEIIKAFFEKLCDFGRAEISQKLVSAVSILHTSIEEQKAQKNAPLVSMYAEFQNTVLELCGRYTDSGFLPDTEQTIDKFSVYRKYYG